MNTAELIDRGQRLLERVRSTNQESEAGGRYAEAAEFLRVFAGPSSAFYEQIRTVHDWFWKGRAAEVVGILESFLAYLEAGLHAALPPERQAQIDTVSDYLEQAGELLETEAVHPVAAAVLVGASLEEFLRTLVEHAGLPLDSRKRGIDSYAKILRDADLISKQDTKDITSWAGIRNHAAHGEWEQVGDRKRIRLMLEGVNLFMRQHVDK